MMEEEYRVSSEDEGQRLDQFLASKLEDVSRSKLRRWLDEGHVVVEGARVKPSLPLKEGWTILLDRPEEPTTELTPEAIPLHIVHEDEELLIVFKPAGLTVHPGAGRTTSTLVHALLHRYPGESWPGPPERPGIVHRLDRETSGLLVVARTSKSYLELQKQISEHKIRRAYTALVWGVPQPSAGSIDAPIGRDPKDRKKMAVVRRRGKKAKTHYRTLRSYEQVSLLEVRLETGRTHQIRVHMSHAGFPIVGDPTYGGGRKFLPKIAPPQRPLWSNRLRRLNRQALHAYHLSLRHPRDGKWWVFEAPLPEDFEFLLRQLTRSTGGLDEVHPS